MFLNAFLKCNWQKRRRRIHHLNQLRFYPSFVIVVFDWNVSRKITKIPFSATNLFFFKKKKKTYGFGCAAISKWNAAKRDEEKNVKLLDGKNNDGYKFAVIVLSLLLNQNEEEDVPHAHTNGIHFLTRSVFDEQMHFDEMGWDSLTSFFFHSSCTKHTDRFYGRFSLLFEKKKSLFI